MHIITLAMKQLKKKVFFNLKGVILSETPFFKFKAK